MTFIHFRRKREAKTNYRKRLKTLLSGKSRVVIRPSLTRLNIQLINFSPAGDKIVLGVSSANLIKLGWTASLSNIPSSYLTGYLFGVKCKKANIKQAILDIGFKTSVKGNKVYAAAKGIVDAGIKIPVDNSVFPSEERIKGAHISAYAKTNLNNFSSISKRVDLLKIDQLFDKVKQKIGAEQ